jgi:hypothetical protein
MYHEKEAKIYHSPVRVLDLIRKVKNGEIIFPDDVRSWNIQENPNLVENILLDIQPNDLLFQVTGDGKWIVRHGFETVKGIEEYLVYDENAPIQSSKSFPLRYENNTYIRFSDLNPIWYNAVNEHVIKCTFISPSTSKEIVDDLVDRFKGKEV